MKDITPEQLEAAFNAVMNNQFVSEEQLTPLIEGMAELIVSERLASGTRIFAYETMLNRARKQRGDDLAQPMPSDIGHGVKTYADAQHAHNMIIAVILGDVKIDVTEKMGELMRAQCDVLCWLLGHTHNNSFAANLAGLQVEIREAGYESTPLTPEEIAAKREERNRQ